ncbi:MAG: tetratricopeptide repeat protein [Anaerolineales bacterium]|nr:tetratricopeptide repeat protein [Anaerolineales bacterium]
MNESDKRFSQILDQASTAAWEQKWNDAAAYYRQALELSPENPLVLNNLGLALYELQALDEALVCYQKAAKLAPDDPLPLERMSQIYEALEQNDHAVMNALRAAELNLKTKSLNRAIENLEYVVALQPSNISAHLRLAMINEKMGKIEEAINETLLLASLYQHTGNAEKAAQAIQHAQGLDPIHPEVVRYSNLYTASKSLPLPSQLKSLESRSKDKIVPQLTAPSEDVTDPSKLDPIQATCNLALSYLAEMIFDTAETEAQEQKSSRWGIQSLVQGMGLTRQTDPTRALMHLSQAIDLHTRSEFRNAADEFEKAIEAGLSHPAAFFELGWLYHQNERLESAVKYLRMAAGNEEFALGARLLSGHTLFMMSRYTEASNDYLEALKYADVSLLDKIYREELLQSYEPIIDNLHQEEDDGAHKQICESISRMLYRSDWINYLNQTRVQLTGSKDNPVVDARVTPLAEILMHAGTNQVVDSIAHINRLKKDGLLRSAMEEAYYVLEFAPSYMPLHAIMVEILLQQGFIEDAISKMRVMAKSYVSRGETSRAIEYFGRIVELAPMDLETRRDLIEQLKRNGQNMRALDEYLDLGEIYYNLAETDEARQVYSEAVKLAQLPGGEDSTKIKLYKRLADIYMQSLDWRLALNCFEQILMLDPGEEDAAYNLASLQLQTGQDAQALVAVDNYITHLYSQNNMDNVFEFLNSLAEEFPTQPALKIKLAQAYQKNQQYPEAVTQYDAAGDLYLSKGNREGAIQAVEAILKLNPEKSGEYQKLLLQLKLPPKS